MLGAPNPQLMLWKSWHLEDTQSQSRAHPDHAHATTMLGRSCSRTTAVHEGRHAGVEPGPGGAVWLWLCCTEQEGVIFSKQCQLERDCSMAASQWRAAAAGTALGDPDCAGILLGQGSALLLLQLLVTIPVL